MAVLITLAVVAGVAVVFGLGFLVGVSAKTRQIKQGIETQKRIHQLTREAILRSMTNGGELDPPTNPLEDYRA